ncbi:lathosterol oxidase-like [Sycon ciliatum]|uniref:lathosterol oxidase-like n=1 Tax=Sycon ciliatum TaxID=27933 RepID=UPI0031F6E299
MDYLLAVVDPRLTEQVYPTSWTEDYWPRQLLTLFTLTLLFAFVMYFSVAAVCYVLLYNRCSSLHPLFKPRQIVSEIRRTLSTMPFIVFATSILFLVEVRGYSRLHDGHFWRLWTLVEAATYVFFTDMAIYFLHRLLHTPRLYAHFHKPHHVWKVPTPFSGQATTAIDSVLLSSPYHIFVFLVPLNKILYLIMFSMINVWTIAIHSGGYNVPQYLHHHVMDSQHHDIHHRLTNYNYGQYFTLWDHIGGTYLGSSSGISRVITSSPPTSELCIRRKSGGEFKDYYETLRQEHEKKMSARQQDYERQMAQRQMDHEKEKLDRLEDSKKDSIGSHGKKMSARQQDYERKISQRQTDHEREKLDRREDSKKNSIGSRLQREFASDRMERLRGRYRRLHNIEIPAIIMESASMEMP